MASENEKTVFGVPGLPIDLTDEAPEVKEESPGEKTIVGLSFGADELAQLESAIASVERRETAPSAPAAPKPSTPRAAPLPPPRPRGATTSAPAAVAVATPEPPANGTVLMTAADFGDLDQLLSGTLAPESGSSADAPATESAAAAASNATMLFDADDVGDALSGVFGQITSGVHASRVDARLEAPPALDEVDVAFAATEMVSSDARIAALAAWEEEQRVDASKADVRPPAHRGEPTPLTRPDSTPAAKVEPAPVVPAETAAGTLLMSAEMVEQAAAAALAAAVASTERPASSEQKPTARPSPAATVLMAADSGTPDSSSTRKAYSAEELSGGKTEIPAPEKTKRYQTGATPRVEPRAPHRDSVRREAAPRPGRNESPDRAPARRDSAALWIAGVATVLVLAAVAWFFLR